MPPPVMGVGDPAREAKGLGEAVGFRSLLSSTNGDDGWESEDDDSESASLLSSAPSVLETGCATFDDGGVDGCGEGTGASVV